MTGLDVSAALIDVAKVRRDAANLSFRVDDAQTLDTFSDSSMDIAVSQMAIMDIADHKAMFQAVRRVLQPGGAFVFSLLHPCFEAPFRVPDEPQFLLDDDGAKVAYVVRRYATEGPWTSGGSGVRGHMGAYHRTLSTLVSDLIGAGFVIERLDEPVVEGTGLFAKVPRVIMVCARAEQR